MKSIYRNEKSKNAVWKLYDRQMEDLKISCSFLQNDFHIYAVEIIGHPGKSAEVSLSPRNQDYGKWAVDVIKGLGYDQMACFGGSFGAGIVVKASFCSFICICQHPADKFLIPFQIRSGDHGSHSMNAYPHFQMEQIGFFFGDP